MIKTKRMMRLRSNTRNPAHSPQNAKSEGDPYEIEAIMQLLSTRLIVGKRGFAGKKHLLYWSSVPTGLAPPPPTRAPLSPC